MSSSFIQEIRDEIEIMIRYDEFSSRISMITNVIVKQINKMKRNLIKYDVVIVSYAIMKRFRKLIETMKLHLFDYIDLHFIKYLNEMCWFIFDMYDVVVNETIICRILKRFEWFHKKINVFDRFDVLIDHLQNRLSCFSTKSMSTKRLKIENTRLKISSINVFWRNRDLCYDIDILT